jgi:hypothetical protein
MAEPTQDSELGRSKQSTSPRDHLRHLLTIGWKPTAPLIEKYVKEHGLYAVVEEFEQDMQESPKKSK